MKKWARLAPWAIGALMATLVFLTLALAASFRYENSDDMLLVKGFMGFEGGLPVNFTLYTHTVLARLMTAFGTWMPHVAWFSVFLLALIWLSMATVVKCAVSLSTRRGMGLWPGMAAGAVFLATFALFPTCRVTYTTTAGMAGMAAVAQILAVDDDSPGGALLGALLSIFLLVNAYLLRKMAALPSLAFFILALLWRWTRVYRPFCANGKRMRAMLLTLAALLVALGGLEAVEKITIKKEGLQDYLSWHEARTDLFDYTRLWNHMAPALASDSGLGEAETKLVRQWYFMDENITTEALQAMYAAYEGESKTGAFAKLAAFFSGNTRYLSMAAFLLLLYGLCLLRGRNWQTLAATTLAVMGTFIMLIYLCWRGRVLSRGMDLALFPCGGFLLCMAVNGLKPHAHKRAAALALCALLLATTGVNAYVTLDVVNERPDAISQQREGELESFALANPDKLIVRTPQMLRDTRLFPDVSAGIPQNIIIWGDWYCRTPSWYGQLEKYGVNGREFTAVDWLDSPLVFATADDAPPQELLDYIEEEARAEVVAEPFGETGCLRFFRFTTAEQAALSPA